MKLHLGLGLGILLSFSVLSSCQFVVDEQQSTILGDSGGSGGNGGGSNSTPWTTYTTTSGTTNYRPAGSIANVNLGFMEYIPAGYAGASVGSYPLVIFLHGIGEEGAGTAATLASFRNNTGSSAGVQYNIDHGKYYNAVVLTPQSPGWWNSGNVDKLVNYAISTYKINPKRILITGLSMGGGGTWDYVNAYPGKVAAAIPIAGASGCGTSYGTGIVNNGIKIWSFHAMNDSTVGVGNSQACMGFIGAAMGQVGTFMDGYASSSSADQTAHFSTSTKRWVFESQIDCVDNQGNDWNPKLCQTLYKTGGHGIWGRVYQHATDMPMIWLLNQARP
ncbi:MAG: hypothetical protein JST80_03860 [Bdellovibrionales bacterium]|nr:hypothetical protein [Bdellovibrionales bacterium]